MYYARELYQQPFVDPGSTEEILLTDEAHTNDCV